MSVRFKVLRLELIDLGDSWMTGMTAPAEISGEAKLQALVSSISSALVVENSWYSAPLNLSEHFVGIADCKAAALPYKERVAEAHQRAAGSRRETGAGSKGGSIEQELYS